MVKIKTYLGEIEVEDIYENSLGCHAVTGEGLFQRTWTIRKTEYERLKKEMD